MMQRAAWAAVGVASFLILLKAVAYVLTDSIAMLASLADEAVERPVLVHRLDRDTSGVLLVAKTRPVAAERTHALAEVTLERLLR